MDEMNLMQVTERLAALDEEVRAATEIAVIEAAEVEKTALLTRKAELDEIETRKTIALNITKGTEKTVTVDKREEKSMEQNKVYTPDSAEYRDIFFKTMLDKRLTKEEIELREYISTTTGLAVIPTQTANMIFDSMTKIAPMLNEIELLRAPGGLRFAVQGARIAAAVHVENAPAGLSADTLTTITLGAFEFIKILSISATMKQQAIPVFEAWLTKILAEDLAVVIDNEIINSPNTTGGIADGPAGGWVEGTSQITYVPANGLTYAELMSLIALLPAIYDSGAKFAMNKATFWNQVEGMTDANGNPLVKEDISAPGKYQIKGYPVLIDDNILANEAYLGNFKKVVGNLSQDITIESSMEAGFLNASTYYRGLAIFDCDVADPAAIVKLNVA